MSEQLLTTYSFFAALTENSTDIYRTVYIPICKRALSLYAKKESRGSDQDIRNIISDEYGINVPLLIIRKLIKSVVNDLSRKDKSKFDFQIVESGNNFFFSFKSFSFSNIKNIKCKSKTYQHYHRNIHYANLFNEDISILSQWHFMKNQPFIPYTFWKKCKKRLHFRQNVVAFIKISHILYDS